MKSLILTFLYLAKDTFHRWITRLSSPLARLLVVFFLSLCSLCFMANYVLTAKNVSSQIRQQGGDFAGIMEINTQNDTPILTEDPRFYEETFGCKAVILQSVGSTANIGQESYPIYSYANTQLAEFYPYNEGQPVLLYPKTQNATLRDGPERLTISGFGGTIVRDVRILGIPEDSLVCAQLSGNSRGFILVSPELADAFNARRNITSVYLRLNEMSYASLKRVEDYFRTLGKLENKRLNVNTVSGLLKKMELIMSNQAECRAGFSIGIAVIVGILLTALASMEYRQNEYIYTLMKSFGIHPILLVGSFIVENLFLVAIAFVAAVFAFMEAQKIVLREFFKLGNQTLTLPEIMPDVQLLACALAACVLISSIPIVFAARREIGRVLK